MVTHRTRRGLLHVAVVLCVVLLAGCEFKGASANGAGPFMDDYWQPWPTSLRVYPSSRFTQANRGALLEARIELRDEMGDAVKAAGTVGLELFAAEEGGEALDRRLYRWDVTVRTLEDQRTHFDPVTRTYLFRLELDDAVARRPSVLRVTFTRAADGRRLEAQAPIQPR